MIKWMRTLIVALAILAFSVTAAFAEAKIIVKTDFTTAKYYKVSFKSTDAKIISGQLPSGWSDNSDWNAEIAVSYTATQEDGVTFLSMDKSSGGRAQLANNISKKQVLGTYRFVMELRSTTSSIPEIGIRLSGEPYTFLWSTQPKLGDDWETIDEEFDIDPDGKPIGIYICIPENGILDIKSVRLEQIAVG